jgi:hypothetical protein
MNIPNLPYGIDVRTLPNAQGILDVDASGLEGSGRVLLSDSLVRRQTTPRGSFADCPDDCLDVRAWLSSGVTQQQLLANVGGLQKELCKDQRVISCQIVPTYLNGVLTLVENFVSGYGPFTMTLSVTAVSIAVLLTDT